MLMRTMPLSAGEVNMPDMPDTAQLISSLRQALKDTGDSRWMLSDAELAAQFSSRARSLNLQQPQTNADVRDISLTELASIMNTRKRFPAFRSDLVIPDEIQQAVMQFANNSASRSALSIPPPQLNNIPDDVAVKAIFDQNQNLPVPLTFTPSQNYMRRKMSYPVIPSGFASYPSNVRGLGVVGPLVTHANRYMSQLNAFSAFSDDTTDAPVDDSGVTTDYTGAYVPVDSTGATASPNVTSSGSSGGGGAGSSFGTNLVNALPSLLTAGTNVYSAARGNPNSPKPVTVKPASAGMPAMNTTMLLLAGVALVFFVMSAKKKPGRR